MERAFSDSEVMKLKEIVNEGIQVYTEIETLKDGLKETVNAIAEELDLKPAVLNKAIRTAYKADLEVKKQSINDIEEILETISRNF